MKKIIDCDYCEGKGGWNESVQLEIDGHWTLAPHNCPKCLGQGVRIAWFDMLKYVNSDGTTTDLHEVFIGWCDGR